MTRRLLQTAQLRITDCKYNSKTKQCSQCKIGTQADHHLASHGTKPYKTNYAACNDIEGCWEAKVARAESSSRLQAQKFS